VSFYLFSTTLLRDTTFALVWLKLSRIHEDRSLGGAQHASSTWPLSVNQLTANEKLVDERDTDLGLKRVPKNNTCLGSTSNRKSARCSLRPHHDRAASMNSSTLLIPYSPLLTVQARNPLGFTNVMTRTTLWIHTSLTFALNSAQF
jgi:hypothetical protein